MGFWWQRSGGYPGSQMGIKVGMGREVTININENPTLCEVMGYPWKWVATWLPRPPFPWQAGRQHNPSFLCSCPLVWRARDLPGLQNGHLHHHEPWLCGPHGAAWVGEGSLPAGGGDRARPAADLRDHVVLRGLPLGQGEAPQCPVALNPIWVCAQTGAWAIFVLCDSSNSFAWSLSLPFYLFVKQWMIDALGPINFLYSFYLLGCTGF